MFIHRHLILLMIADEHAVRKLLSCLRETYCEVLAVVLDDVELSRFVTVYSIST
jgi:hypothetical protein